MSNFTAHICSWCGASLEPVGNDRHKCSNCGRTYSDGNLPFKRAYESFMQMLDERIAEENAAKLARLVRRRYEIVSEKYVSNEELKSICEDILSHYDDKDFYSRFYRATYERNRKAVSKFLAGVDIEEHYDDLDDMMNYLITGLKSDWSLAVGNFIEKVKSYDVEKYDGYRTRFEAMNEKLEDGVFEPTLPRDAFIMYSSADMEKVEELADVLEKEYDLNCFVAARNLRHGSGSVERYTDAIHTAIKNCKTVVFISSSHSRTPKCETYQEMIYIEDNYPKKPRIEWLIENYAGKGVEAKFREFFSGMEYCTSADEVANRVLGYKTSSVRKDESDKQRTVDDKSNIDDLLFEADMLCAQENYDASVEMYKSIMASHKDDIRGYIGIIKAQSANYTLLYDHKTDNFVKLLNSRFGEEKAKSADREYAKFIARLGSESKAPEKKATVSKSAAAEKPEFEIKNGVLIKYNGTSKNVVIPHGVTSIGSSAFKDCGSLTGVTIPDSVTSIDSDAFCNCVSLNALTIGNAVTSIGQAAFYNCKNLTNITISDSVTSIGERAFYECASLVSITIPEGVISIGNYVFSYCTSLESVTIGNGVTSIGERAFYECASLVSITIGNSVTSIGDDAFSGCTSLKAVYITDISKWCAINFGSVDANPLYCANNLYLNGELVTDLVIPEGVTSIDKYAFYECASLVSITIPNGVTSIGDSAFSGCSNLESIILPFIGATNDGTENMHFGYIFGASSYDDNSSYVPSSLKTVIITNATSIGPDAFEDCTSLESITIPDSVTSIGYSAFYDCTSLKNITIPDSVTSIDDAAFENCTSLKNITIPDSVTSIGSSAFSACSSLKSITIPDSVISIGYGAFYNCTSLTYNEYDNAHYLGNDSNPYLVLMEVNDKSINSCVMHDSTEIIYSAFSSCKKLKNATIPKSVKSICSDAFCDCSKLSSIKIPDSVTSIGNYAFSRCTSLDSIEVDSNNSNYKSIDGNLYSKDGKTLIQYAIGKTDTSFTIPDGVTSIGYRAFYACKNLRNITIPDSVTSIGCLAFNICTSLKSITISGGVTSIGENAFSGCTSLISITIPGGVTSIGDGVFSGCKKLKSITIPDSVTSIDDMAFNNCTSLKSITIPDSVTSIGYWAFHGCKLKIYCRANEMPKEWSVGWNKDCSCKVIWGYKGD